MLDPCCGTGEPLALLGRHLGLTTYGNELHPERFAQARTRLDHCLNGPREFLEVEGQFSAIFDNPPVRRFGRCK
jgi:tRNA G10  N-methylase Trm11